jgi:hypothetical protein
VLRVLVVLGACALTGCGFNPPAPPAASPAVCTDGPTPEIVQQATAPGWTETARGHANGCRLHWVQVAPQGATASSPGQVLFFDRNTALGTATPDPRPFITVLPSGPEAVLVQYQWLVGDEPNCCPTGLGTVRFRIGADGALETLDPIPIPIPGP